MRCDAMRCDVSWSIDRSPRCQSSSTRCSNLTRRWRARRSSIVVQRRLVQRARPGSLQVTHSSSGQQKLPSTGTAGTAGTASTSLCHCIYLVLCNCPCSCDSFGNDGLCKGAYEVSLQPLEMFGAELGCRRVWKRVQRSVGRGLDRQGLTATGTGRNAATRRGRAGGGRGTRTRTVANKQP